jgi:hypothetical protein|tara:strand:- start:2337 stop:2525 length:189 start_codon:yes stop_codon:yes gene_type:complete
MISWLINKYEDFKFEREFQKKKKQLMELDPFIYDIPSETKDHPGSEPTRYKTWENKGKDIDF